MGVDSIKSILFELDDSSTKPDPYNIDLYGGFSQLSQASELDRYFLAQEPESCLVRNDPVLFVEPADDMFARYTVEDSRIGFARLRFQLDGYSPEVTVYHSDQKSVFGDYLQDIGRLLILLKKSDFHVNGVIVHLHDSGIAKSVVVNTTLGKFIFNNLSILTPAQLSAAVQHKFSSPLVLSEAVTWKPHTLNRSYQWTRNDGNGRISYTYDPEVLGYPNARAMDFGAIQVEFHPKFPVNLWYKESASETDVDFDRFPPHYLNNLNTVALWLNAHNPNLATQFGDQLKYIHVSTLVPVDMANLTFQIEYLDKDRNRLGEFERLLVGDYSTPTKPKRNDVKYTSVDPAPTEDYTVRAGDTLSRIALRYGLSWQDLWRWNQDTIQDPNKIFVGQTIQLTESIQKQETIETIQDTKGHQLVEVESRAEVVSRSDPSIVTDRPSQNGLSDTEIYRVKQGDTLESIAAQFKHYETTAESIFVFNRKVLPYRTSLPAGVNLVIPKFAFESTDILPEGYTLVDDSSPSGQVVAFHRSNGKTVLVHVEYSKRTLNSVDNYKEWLQQKNDFLSVLIPKLKTRRAQEWSVALQVQVGASGRAVLDRRSVKLARNRPALSSESGTRRLTF